MSDATKSDANRDERAGAAPASGGAEEKLTLLGEELSVAKEKREAGRVRVATRTQEREAAVDEDLAQECIEIEKVPVGRPVDRVPQVRQEGDTAVVPAVEEVLRVERQPVLEEEVRIGRVRTTGHRRETVTLRRQEAVVTRRAAEPPQSEAEPSTGPTAATDRKGRAMACETIVAVFDTPGHADAAVKALRAGGFANADIGIFDDERLAAGKKSVAAGERVLGGLDHLDLPVGSVDGADVLGVVEEVSLEKIGKEHVETIGDKLRRQQMEVERLGPDGKPIPSARQRARPSK